MDLRWEILTGYLPLFVRGLWMTLQLTLVAISAGLVLGIFFGLVSSSRDAPQPRQLILRVGLRLLLRVGFTRWHVEHLFRVAKDEVGLTHFEGRSYASLKRHLALCLTVMAFVSLHTTRLRGEKSAGDPGAGLPGAETGLPDVSGPATRHQ